MKKLFSMLMVALLLGTMVGCNGNGNGNGKSSGGDNASASKLSDSITETFGDLLGGQLKMMKEQQGIDPEEVIRGLEEVSKLVKTDTSKKSASFNQGLAMGVQLFSQMEQQNKMIGISINKDKLLKLARKAASSKDSMDMAQMQIGQTHMQEMMMRATQIKGKENDQKGKKYIDEQIKKDKAFKKTDTGIAYKVIKAGNGANFNDSAVVDVEYVGKHIDGNEFDNSKGKSVPMNLKMTVPGFREVISKMKPGEKGIAIIPGSLAYGDQGNPQGGIGPNETLVFEITAVGIHKEEPKPAAMPMPGNAAPAPAGKQASKATPTKAVK